MERRANTRYRLGARAVFSWEGPDQKRFQGEGVTRDISLSGTFILTLSCPPAQALVHVGLFLPPFLGTVATARIKADARVLRVEHATTDEQQSGFAIDSPGFSFLSGVELGSESESSLTQQPKDSER
jgi:hypothetical protein